MPRNLLPKRRFASTGVAAGSGMSNERRGMEQLSSPEFEEEPALSESSSSDSGRESARPDEIQSPSASHERPAGLNIRSSNVSSSSSSDSLQLKSESPSSPYPSGHISLLPGILENLAVSGNHTVNQVIQATLLQQLPRSAPYDINNPVGADSNVYCHPERNNHTVTGASAQPLPGLLELLSPASRKRANSLGNSNPNINKPTPKQRKIKNGRRLPLEDATSSPVSGTYIKPDDVATVDKDVIIVRKGDFDKSTNVVEITEEAKRELEKIENKIGDYACKLCKLTFHDAFALAGHNCSRIVNIEYQCPECGKAFHCPANLASHRRWHKPKSASAGAKIPKNIPEVTTPPELPKSSVEACLVSPTSSSIPVSNMPFKKRFMFGSKVQGSSNQTEKKKIETEEKPAPTGTEQPSAAAHPVSVIFQCQLCQGCVQGTQEFAKHWQTCFFMANRSWTPFVLASRRF